MPRRFPLTRGGVALLIWALFLLLVTVNTASDARSAFQDMDASIQGCFFLRFGLVVSVALARR